MPKTYRPHGATEASCGAAKPCASCTRDGSPRSAAAPRSSDGSPEGDRAVDHEVAHGLADEPIRVLVAHRARDRLSDRVTFL
ncbi:hypothetical protein [Streptomyces sp. CBMA152]|uniref:hypothetical protein n=1 Tax=Streptomyces sp. CBMA152 TaxID=1896312 RepID=UPI0016616EC5|nr:hypothetical protein [Streptomyces sp. CBMA152]